MALARATLERLFHRGERARLRDGDAVVSLDPPPANGANLK